MGVAEGLHKASVQRYAGSFPCPPPTLAAPGHAEEGNLAIHLTTCPVLQTLPGLDCHPFLPGLEQLHLFLNIILFINIYLFSAALVVACGPSLVVASGGYPSLWYAGFSLCWILLWSMGSRCMGFGSCGSWA